MSFYVEYERLEDENWGAGIHRSSGIISEEGSTLLPVVKLEVNEPSKSS